jgi:hypothetical protein
MAAFELLDSEAGEKLVKKLWANTKFFKNKLKKLGFKTGESETRLRRFWWAMLERPSNFRDYSRRALAMAIGFDRPRRQSAAAHDHDSHHKRVDLSERPKSSAASARGSVWFRLRLWLL